MVRKRYLILIFCLSVTVVTIGQLPLSLAFYGENAQRAGLTAKQLSGTLWSGKLEGAQLSGLRLGAVKVRGNPLGLLGIGPIARLRWQGQASVGSAALSITDASTTLTDIALRMPLAADGLDGIAIVTNGEVVLASKRCIKAGGQVAFNSPIRSETVTGALECQSGQLVAIMIVRGASLTVPFRGQS